MRAIVDKFGADVDFLAVYVMEAHTTDGWRLGSYITRLPQHTSMEDRVTAARQWSRACKFPIRVMVDTMANEFSRRFEAWPERLVIVRDGILAYVQKSDKTTGASRLWTDEVDSYFSLQR